MRLARNLILAGLVAAAGACKQKPAPKVPLNPAQQGGAMMVDTSPQAIANNPHRMISPEAKAALDSGNALYRAGKYQPALAQYRLAAKLAPANGAPFYGIYMAADKLGNKALADSAATEFQRRTQGGAPLMADSLMKKAHGEKD